MVQSLHPRGLFLAVLVLAALASGERVPVAAPARERVDLPPDAEPAASQPGSDEPDDESDPE